jgi:regulation of enolase protein 1 (concanavalin A-like superfamily)
MDRSFPYNIDVRKNLTIEFTIASSQYKQLYEEGGFKEVFAGWISPTRFFYEALTVGEYRCLPEQSGYTIEETSINRQANTSMTIVLGYAGHDYNAVRWSCSGWYWSVLPVLLIGFT